MMQASPGGMTKRQCLRTHGFWLLCSTFPDRSYFHFILLIHDDQVVDLQVCSEAPCRLLAKEGRWLEVEKL
jgi:hypothetical protein